MSDEQEETKQQAVQKNQVSQKVGMTNMMIARDNFPDSDKEEENEGSEGIDEGFL